MKNLFLIAVSLIIVCSNLFAQVNLDSGLVVYYPFNGNANDESGNGSDGVVLGAILTVDRFGNNNSAYRFDGEDDYIISEIEDWIATEYSISIWVKASELGQPLFSAMINNFNDSLAGAHPEDSFQFDVDGNNPGNYRLFFSTKSVLFGQVSNEWQNLTATYDGTLVTTYVNGEFTSQDTLPVIYGRKFRDYVIGRNRGAIKYFNGIIDDIRIYNRSITEQEIHALYFERIVRMADVKASIGSTVSIPIEFIAKGNENALGFSLIFDSSVLSNPQAIPGSDASSATLISNTSQVDLGQYGIALALPAGNTFVADTNEVVIVSFSVNSNTLADSTLICFGDQPIAREVVNVNVDTVATDWIPGTVYIFRGYEADVVPRPYGNNDGRVTIADWVQVGRFAAVLDTPRIDVNEFQRADCSPRPCGDGRTGISDWVQAGRYAAGLDTVVIACGPFSPTFSITNAMSKNYVNLYQTIETSTVRAVNAIFCRDSIDSLIIELDAQGNENSLGFSLLFDPNLFTFEEFFKGKGANNATLIPNTSKAANGCIGVALALPIGETFAAGTHEIVIVTFKANSVTTSDSIQFGDDPISREVVDANANVLPADWVPAKIVITYIKDIPGKAPLSFELLQNYPNPFNLSTTIEFSIPKSDRVTLKVFNLKGEEVVILAEQKFTAGRYKAYWDASGFESGIYFYQLKVGQFVQSKKLILVK